MNITIEVTEQDIARGKADNQLPLMYALDRAGFNNAFIAPDDTSLVVSATVSHIQGKLAPTTVEIIGVWDRDHAMQPGFHQIELAKAHAAAFGLHIDDGLERRERDELLNPTVDPENQTTKEAIGTLDNPSPATEPGE